MRKDILAVAFLVAFPSLSLAAILERTASDRGTLTAMQHQLSIDKAGPVDGNMVLAEAKKKGKLTPPPPPRRRPKVSPHK